LLRRGPSPKSGIKILDLARVADPAIGLSWGDVLAAAAALIGKVFRFCVREPRQYEKDSMLQPLSFTVTRRVA
jgi:hypothetical protein